MDWDHLLATSPHSSSFPLLLPLSPSLILSPSLLFLTNPSLFHWLLTPSSSSYTVLIPPRDVFISHYISFSLELISSANFSIVSIIFAYFIRSFINNSCPAFPQHINSYIHAFSPLFSLILTVFFFLQNGSSRSRSFLQIGPREGNSNPSSWIGQCWFVPSLFNYSFYSLTLTGKTTLLKKLSSEELTNVTPTKGFNVKTIASGGIWEGWRERE